MGGDGTLSMGTCVYKTGKTPFVDKYKLVNGEIDYIENSGGNALKRDMIAVKDKSQEEIQKQWDIKSKPINQIKNTNQKISISEGTIKSNNLCLTVQSDKSVKFAKCDGTLGQSWSVEWPYIRTSGKCLTMDKSKKVKIDTCIPITNKNTINQQRYPNGK